MRTKTTKATATKATATKANENTTTTTKNQNMKTATAKTTKANEVKASETKASETKANETKANEVVLLNVQQYVEKSKVYKFDIIPTNIETNDLIWLLVKLNQVQTISRLNTPMQFVKVRQLLIVCKLMSAKTGAVNEKKLTHDQFKAYDESFVKYEAKFIELQKFNDMIKGEVENFNKLSLQYVANIEAAKAEKIEAKKAAKAEIEAAKAAKKPAKKTTVKSEAASESDRTNEAVKAVKKVLKNQRAKKASEATTSEVPTTKTTRKRKVATVK